MPVPIDSGFIYRALHFPVYEMYRVAFNHPEATERQSVLFVN